MGDSNNADITLLVEQLAAHDADRRAEAAELLCRLVCRLGKAAAGATLDLVTACCDEDERVREWAVAALEEIGPPPRGMTARLAEFVAGPNPLAAYWAATLLGRSGQDAATAVAVLAACVGSAADPSVRQRAAWALGKIGPAAAAAAETLQRAAGQKEDPRLARLARDAIESIGG